MKLLFITSAPRGDITTGQGLILTRMSEMLEASGSVEVRYAHFRVPVEKLSSQYAVDQTPPLFSVTASSLNRKRIALGALGWGGRNARRELARALSVYSKGFDAIIWMGLPTDPVSAMIPKYTGLPVIYYIIDSYALHSARREGGAVDWMRAMLAKRIESRILRAGFRTYIYVSQEDYDFANRLSLPSVRSRIKLLPIGVDLKQWSPGGRTVNHGKPVVLFSGVMNFAPNITAAQYFVREVLPLISGDFEFRIVGKDPTPEVRSLAEADSRIVVTGTVKDIVAEYRNADIFVAPMVGTAGIKIKILQAMATGLPVVATTTCAVAFPDPPASLLIADSPLAFARALDELLQRPDICRARGADGRKFVEAGWSWAARAAGFLELVKRLSPSN